MYRKAITVAVPATHGTIAQRKLYKVEPSGNIRKQPRGAIAMKSLLIIIRVGTIYVDRSITQCSFVILLLLIVGASLVSCTASTDPHLSQAASPATALRSSSPTALLTHDTRLQTIGVATTTITPELHRFLWTYKAQGTLQSSLIATDESLYLITDGYLREVNSHTGIELWNVPASENSLSISDNNVYYSWKGILHCLDSKTKKEKWIFQASDYILASPAVANGVVYFGSVDGYFYAVDNFDGQQKWKSKVGDQIVSNPVFANGTIYFGSENIVPTSADTVAYKSSISAVTTETGQLRWRYRPEDSVDVSQVIDGIVYGISTNKLSLGFVYALDAETGKEEWKYQPEAGLTGPPVVAYGMLYIGSHSGKLTAIDSKTKQKKWSFNAENWVGSPSAANGIVYFGSGDKTVYAVDALTGQGKWKLTTDSPVIMPPIIEHGMIYFTDGSKVYATTASGN